jgi:hypothetical protein
MMPRRKVEVFPNESRGVPERKSRCSRTKVEVFPNAPFLGLPNVEAIFTPSLPPVGGGVRVGGIVVPMRKLPPSAFGPGPPGFGRRSAFRADGRRVGPMEDTQVWEEVK